MVKVPHAFFPPTIGARMTLVGMSIRDFRELDVFKMAIEGAMWIFEKSKLWPVSERFELTSQILRASRSVGSNIAEAWRKRRLYVAAFISKLSDAETEAAETQVWLMCAFKCGYITETEWRKWDQHYSNICGKLVRMSDQPEKWCPKEAFAT